MDNDAQHGISPWADCHETHVSAVFLAGDKVLKFKKPVHTDFLDFTTVEARQQACRDEVRLNSRLSPDVYLGVADVDLGEAVPEPAVVMRRLDDADRLETRLSGDRVRLSEDLRSVAHVIAAFHGRVDVHQDRDSFGTWSHVVIQWLDEWSSLAVLDPSLSPNRRRGIARQLGLRYLAGRRALFDERHTHGKIRDGHGDLRADHVYLTADGVRIVDCLEFDPVLRAGDVLADVAFLAMDLERLGRPDAAAELLAFYDELTGEVHPTSLVDFYIAQRALVRLKVALLKPGPRTRSDLNQQSQLLSLAERHLAHASPTVTLIGGLPGSGKSTIGSALAVRRDSVYLSTDAIRHERMSGADPTTHDAWREGRYSDEEIDAVYAELLSRAAIALAGGYSVILDASWSDERRRGQAREVASGAAALTVEICCQVGDTSATRRLRETRANFSEADDEVRQRMRAVFDQWPTAVALSTEREVTRSLQVAEGILDRAAQGLLDRLPSDLVGEDRCLGAPLEPQLR